MSFRSRPGTSPRTPASDREAWSILASQLNRDAAVWLFIMLCLTGYRCALVALLGEALAWRDLALALVWGMRFDAVIATIVVAPSCIAAILAWTTGRTRDVQRLRIACTWLFFVLGVPVYVANIAYFIEFDDQLDQRCWNIVTDTDHSVARTVWEAYHPLTALVACTALAWGAARICGRLADRWTPLPLRAIESRPIRGLTILLAITALVACVRGFSLSVSPVRIRNAFVTTTPRLNRTIPSPVAAFLHATEDMRARRAPVPQAEYDHAAACVEEQRGAATVSPASPTRFVRHCPGVAKRPRHMFVIIMEGQHGFPLLEPYRSMGLLPCLDRLAADSAWFPAFVPSGMQTDTTLGAVVAGIFSPRDTLLPEVRSLKPFETSLPVQLGRLGYRTRFFYAGFPGWARLDLFAPAQGFEEVFSAADRPGAPGNAWGMWDGELHRLVLDKVDPTVPSVNVLLTTTNHSPYDLDPALRVPLPSGCGPWDDATQTVLEHERYADRALGAFVTEAKTRFPDALFVITGDHTAHAAHVAINGRSVYENLSTPLLLYGECIPRAWRRAWAVPASHLDIAPTLYDLCAPRGFTYVSFGHPLFTSPAPRFAAGAGAVITASWMLPRGEGEWLPIPGTQAGDRPRPDDTTRAHAFTDALDTLGRAALFGVGP